MTGEIVPFRPTRDEETRKKARLLAWLDELAKKVIETVVQDIAVRFHDPDDEAEPDNLDLAGAYNPIVEVGTGLRVSDAIEKFAENEGCSEKTLRRLYVSRLREKWKQQPQRISDPSGSKFGAYLVNTRTGVWTQLNAGAEGLYVWRRIARTPIEPVALSRDTTRHRNWRHRYRITDETGQHFVDIDAADLGKTADRAIRTLMRRGVHVVESKEARQHLAKHLRFRPRARITRVPKIGWHVVKRDRWVSSCRTRRWAT
jgi:hypothetical protein